MSTFVSETGFCSVSGGIRKVQNGDQAKVLVSVLVLYALSQLPATVPCGFVCVTHVTFWRRGEAPGKALQKILGLGMGLYQMLNWNLTVKSKFLLRLN